MLGLFVFFSLNIFFTKLFFLSHSLAWYIFIAKLINTYWNFFIIFIIASFFSRLQIKVIFFFFTFLLYLFDCFWLVQLTSIPSQLLVGYNNIHPVFFYFSFVLSFFYTSSWKMGFFLRLKTILFASSIALLLGGLWGCGNSVWGFFWVNDSIELILFFLTCFLLVVLHSESSKNNALYLFTYLFILVIWIFLLRWGFTFTRHNFFDLRKLVNSSFYSFLFITQGGVLLFFVTTFLIFFNFFLYFLLIFLFSCFSFNLSFFKNFILLLHLSIFIFFFCWLSYRQNNFLLFNLSNHVNYNVHNSTLSASNLLTTDSFLKFKFFTVANYYQSVGFLYPFKKKLLFKVFMSYSFYWVFFIYLFFI